MISLKIQGMDKLIQSLSNTDFIEPTEIDKVINLATRPLVRAIEAGYDAKHTKTGALRDSVMAFRRNRKKGEPYFTYFVGPRYTAGGKYSLFSYGGNAAHLLEFGTIERFRANTKLGGVGKKVKGKSTGIKGVYGAKIKTGKVEPYGVIRKATDATKEQCIQIMSSGISNLIKKQAKLQGLQVA
jgi:hypothetical protein